MKQFSQISFNRMKYFLQCLTILAVTFMGCQSNEPSEPSLPQVVQVSNDKVTFDDGSELALPAGETILFAVTHAEPDEMSGQPGLTEAGKKEAAKLDSLLRNVDFRSVLATTSKATSETIQPILDSKNLEKFAFDAEAADRLFQFVFEYEKGNNFLMVGDNATIPKVLNMLDTSFVADPIAKDKHNALFVVVGSGKGASKVYAYEY
jgi:hypothetical protein